MLMEIGLAAIIIAALGLLIKFQETPNLADYPTGVLYGGTDPIEKCLCPICPPGEGREAVFHWEHIKRRVVKCHTCSTEYVELYTGE